MVKIGIVGIGFMGRIHYLATQRLMNGKVTAICTRDSAKLTGDWRNTLGNFGPKPDFVDLTGIKCYREYSDVLNDPEIDLVDICNPTHFHADYAIEALNAGKHVLVEKAIALSIDDANRMIEAATLANKMLFVAHVLPFFPEFAFATQICQSGQYGRLLAAHFRRVISKPEWSAEMANAAITGGPAVDLHIHDTHFIGLLCGKPIAVESNGLIEQDVVTYLTTQYRYGLDGPAISCSSGAIATVARPFVHGYELYLERATVAFQSDGHPLAIYSANGEIIHPELAESGDPIAAFSSEIQAAVDAIVIHKPCEILSASLARDALIMCHKEIESVRGGSRVDLS